MKRVAGASRVAPTVTKYVDYWKDTSDRARPRLTQSLIKPAIVTKRGKQDDTLVYIELACDTFLSTRFRNGVKVAKSIRLIPILFQTGRIVS